MCMPMWCMCVLRVVVLVHAQLCVCLCWVCMCVSGIRRRTSLCVYRLGLSVCVGHVQVHTEAVSVRVQVHYTPAPESADLTPWMKTPLRSLGAPDPSPAVGEESHQLLTFRRSSTHLLALLVHGRTRHLPLLRRRPLQSQDTRPWRCQPDRHELTAS